MEDLFLKILNMSITATYVLLAVLVLRTILKRAPKWISYALWSLVLFRLVFPVSISSVFSVFGRIVKTTSTDGGMEHIPVDIGMMSVPQVDIGTTGMNMATNNALPAATPVAGANPMQIFVFIGACIWLAGIALMLIYSIVSYLRLNRRIMDATRFSGNIFETDKISSPFVCGLIKPRIYLPVGLSDDERQYVLRHEQTHILRRDYIIKPLAFLVLSVHWFNPFIWLAFILMSRDLEMSCDEKVVSGLDSEGKVGYSSALIQLAMKHPILAGSPLAFGERGAKGRIKNVLNYKKPSFWILTVAVVIAVTAGFTLLTDPIESASNNKESEIIPLSMEEIEQYNKIFEPLIIDVQGNTVVNPRSHFLTSYYDRPGDINLAECLRYFPAEADVTNEAEFLALKEATNWPFGADMTLERMPVPIHKFSAGVVNGVLLKNMGIALDDLSGVGMDELIYLESYDAYYNFTSDFAAGSFVCTSGETQGDIIRLYSERATLTLTKHGDSFLFKSHQHVDSAEESMPAAYASAVTQYKQFDFNATDIEIRTTEGETYTNDLDEAVRLALLQKNQGRYSRGECIGEGHIILGQEEESGITRVFALTMYGEYGFENGNFTKVSGSGIIPVVFTFTNSESGLFCTKMDEPEDGARYRDSIRRLFPPEYQDRIFSPANNDSQDLKSQERSYASSYLKRIGRNAEIGNYGDFEHTLLTDVGVSVEVSNSINDKQFANYPFWIGNREALENGICYVYEMSYNEKEHEIVFKKYEYDTNKIVELARLDSTTGLQLNN